MQDDLFQRFFTSLKCASQLTRLELVFPSVTGTDPSVGAGFAALTQLEHLTLSTCVEPTGEFLSQANHAPHLRLVELKHFSSQPPDIELVGRILCALAPTIHLRVQHSRARYFSDAEVAELLALDPKRVTIVRR
jgi:hypothetical protein